MQETTVPKKKTPGLDNKKLGEILDRLKRRDESAIKDLESYAGSRLRSEAKDFLGDYQEGEDAVSEVLRKLWYKSEFYNKKRPALPYVISVLRNHCRDVIRKRGHRVKLHTGDLFSRVYKRLPAQGIDPSLEFTLEEMIPNEFDSKLAKMAFIEGLSVKEIAGITGLAPEGVELTLQRVKKELYSYCDDNSWI